MVICTALFVEGVVVIRTALFSALWSIFFNLSFAANYIKIVLKFKSHSFDENRKGDVRIRCIVFDGRL